MSEQLKQRSVFIAVPIVSDFGFPESKNKGWLTAHEKYEDAEEMKRLFESGGIPHQVIQFYQASYILSIDHAKEGSMDKSVECIATHTADGSTRILSVRDMKTKETAGMKEIAKTCLKCGARYIFPRWTSCKICEHTGPQAPTAPGNPALTPWLDLPTQEKARTAQRAINKIQNDQVEAISDHYRKGISTPRTHELDRRIAELKGMKDPDSLEGLEIVELFGGTYSWSISDEKAFELVDELDTKCFIERFGQKGNWLWSCTFTYHSIFMGPVFRREGKTRPEAICRAYIAAMEGMKG